MVPRDRLTDGSASVDSPESFGRGVFSRNNALSGPIWVVSEGS